MGRLVVLAIAVALSCVSLGQSLPNEQRRNARQTKIVNGVPAPIEDFPYLASLQYNGTFFGHDVDHFCVGSVLNDQWVITTAQCGGSRQPEEFQVRLGSSKYYEGGVSYRIEKVVVHPNFDEISNDYDFALIKLSKKINFSESIKPIALPKSNDDVADSADFTIAGWGATVMLGSISDNLITTHIEKLNTASCQTVYGGRQITDRMFCAFTEGHGPCVGDSGSPTIYNGQIIGLASWTYGCAYENPTVYANVASVVDWIQKTIS